TCLLAVDRAHGSHHQSSSAGPHNDVCRLQRQARPWRRGNVVKPKCESLDPGRLDHACCWFGCMSKDVAIIPAAEKSDVRRRLTQRVMAGLDPAMTYAQRQCEQTESQWFRRLV